MPDKPRIETMEGTYISSIALGEIFGVTGHMVRRYVSEHGMPKEGRGKYLLGDCLKWYINRIRVDADRGDTSDISEEKLKLVRAQRHRVELDNKKVRGQLIDHDTVAGAFNQMGAVFASQLDSLGARSAGILAGISDPGEIQRVLFDECRTIRDNTSAEIIDLAVTFDNGGDNTATTGEGCGPVG